MHAPGVLLRGVLAAALLAASAPPHAAGAPSVVVSIKPVHGLVAGVMEGVGAPQLLLSGSSSPHTQGLKPSQAAALEHADLAVWVGPLLELFLRKPLGQMDAAGRVLTLSSLPGIRMLPAREGGAWDAADHPGHRLDPHLWLSPDNALVIVDAVAGRLATLDPTHRASYLANAARTVERIRATDAAIAARLAPVRDVPYVVFHDAYQYFESHYGTRAVGAVSVSPDRAPGAKRLAALRERILSLRVACIFSEPQFEPRLAGTLTAGTPVRSAVLDPLGATVEAGPDAWFSVVEALAFNLLACLSR